MNVFCLDDLNESDLVPCAGCLNLFHPTVLDGELRCETCIVMNPDPIRASSINRTPEYKPLYRFTG